MTFKTFDRSDEETLPDQHFYNLNFFYNFFISNFLDFFNNRYLGNAQILVREFNGAPQICV